MSILSKKFLLINTSSIAIRRRQHTKIFPDDKWLTLKALKAVQRWLGRQLARGEERCGGLQKPEFGIQQDAPLKDKVIVELKPEMLKYRLLFALCYTRTQIQRIFCSAGVGLEKAAPKMKPIEIGLINVQTEKKTTTPENKNVSSQVKEKRSPENLVVRN